MKNLIKPLGSDFADTYLSSAKVIWEPHVRELEQNHREAIEMLIAYHETEEKYLQIMDASFEIWNKVTLSIEEITGQKWSDLKNMEV